MVRDPITTRKSRWKLIFGVIAVYGMGVISGALGLVFLVSVAAKRPPGDPEPVVVQRFFVKQLDRKLQLTPEQRQEMSVVVRDILTEVTPVREDTRRRVAVVIRSHNPRIREILDDRQEELYAEFLREKAREWHLALDDEKPNSP